MNIGKRKVVTIDYKLTDEDGEVLDSSDEGKPLRYLHGAGNLIEGLEDALEGKVAGDKVQVSLPPDRAYGARDEELVQDVPRQNFPEGEVEVGMQFRAQGEGESRIITVVAVDDEKVTIDANHPLAGMTLAFDVNVLDVRDATIEELRHGHVHGEGGHHHHH